MYTLGKYPTTLSQMDPHSVHMCINIHENVIYCKLKYEEKKKEQIRPASKLKDV